MKSRMVTVFGGSGFIGRHLVHRLATEDTILRVAVRDPEAAKFLKPAGEVGQILLEPANIADEASVRRAVEGADQVVNLVGILFERGRQSFQAIHVEGARNVAVAAKAAGVKRLVHVSALGADPASPSAYARSKAAGEAAVAEAYAQATILRPSVVFGPEDDFLNRFAAMAQLMPVLPVFFRGIPKLDPFKDFPFPSVEFEAGATRLQPAYVGDVAEALAKTLDDPVTLGRSYELGGPEVYRLIDIMRLVLKLTGQRRLLLPLPFAAAEILAIFLGLLPVPPLTRDQVRLLKADNVVAPGALGFADLKITPQALELVAPTYLRRFGRPRAEQTEAS